jgi:hypothetical protein
LVESCGGQFMQWFSKTTILKIVLLVSNGHWTCCLLYMLTCCFDRYFFEWKIIKNEKSISIHTHMLQSKRKEKKQWNNSSLSFQIVSVLGHSFTVSEAVHLGISPNLNLAVFLRLFWACILPCTCIWLLDSPHMGVVSLF